MGDVFDDSFEDYTVLARPCTQATRNETLRKKDEHNVIDVNTVKSIPDKQLTILQPPLSKSLPISRGPFLEDSDTEKDSSSDQSDEDIPLKSKRMSIPFSFKANDTKIEPRKFKFASLQQHLVMVNSASSTQAQGLQKFNEQAAVLQKTPMMANAKTKKKNTVWSNVLNEQEVSSVMSNNAKVDLLHKKVSRGSESYCFKKQVESTYRSDSSSLSDTGLTQEEFDNLKDLPNFVDGDVQFKGPFCQLKKKRFSKSKFHARQKKKHKIFTKLRRMSKAELANYVSLKLREPKTHLVSQIVENVRLEIFLHLFWKSLKVWRRGGLRKRSEYGRRTLGGIFLYLTRNYSKLTELEKLKVSEILTAEKTEKLAYNPRKRSYQKLAFHEKVQLENSRNAEKKKDLPLLPIELDDESAMDTSNASDVDSDDVYGFKRRLTRKVPA